MADSYWPRIFANSSEPKSVSKPKVESIHQQPTSSSSSSNEPDKTANGEPISTSLNMNTPTPRKPSSLTRITTNSDELARLQFSSTRQKPSTASTSRSSIGTGSMLDSSPLAYSTGNSSAVVNPFRSMIPSTSICRFDDRKDALGYPNQSSDRSHGLFGNNNFDSEEITRSFPKKMPSEKIVRQHSRWQELFDDQSKGRSRSHENEDQEEMPPTPVRHRAVERMMSPTAISPHRQRTPLRLEEAAEQRRADMPSSRTRNEWAHRRNALSIPIIEEGSDGDTMNDPHEMYKTTSSYRSNNLATQDQRSSLPTLDYGMSAYYRSRPEELIGSTRFENQNPSQYMAQAMNNLTFHDPVYDTHGIDPLIVQPTSFPMALVPQNLQLLPATNNTNSVVDMGMTNSVNPWDGMVMSSPTLKPSNMLLRQQGRLPPMIEGKVQAPESLDKDEQSSETREEEKVPDQENCALWVTNVASTITPRLFFQMVRCGAVYALHMYPPTGQHKTKAAKLIFKRAPSAATFLQQAKSTAGFSPHGERLKVQYNRNGVREYTGSKTRVVRILGPSQEMLFPVWDTYFRELCVFDYDEVLFPVCYIEGRSIIEFRFMRVDAQSQMIQKEINENPMLQRFKAYFAPDPCGP